MEQLSAAAATVSGIAALVLAALSIVVVMVMRGQVRTFLAALGFGVAVVLAAIAVIGSAPEGDAGPKALAGLELDVPDSDRELVEALMVRAEQDVNRGDTRSALDSYNRARSLYRQLGDIQGEAGVAFGLGRLEHFTGQSDKARANYAEAVSLYTQGGSAKGQARVLAAMGDLEKDTFNWDAARQHYRDARIQWARAPRPRSDPHVLLRLEDLAAMPNGEADARETLEQAQKLYFQVDDPTGKGDASSILGALEFNLGNFDSARSNFHEARGFYQSTGEQKKEAEANLSLAENELYRGYNLEVEMALGFARTLFEQAGDDGGAPLVELVRGRLELMLGRWEVARDIFAQATTDLNALSAKEEPDALMGAGQAELGLGDVEAAAAAFSAATDLFGRYGNDKGLASSLLATSLLVLESGRPNFARANLLRAGSLFAEVGATLTGARTLVTLGRVEVESGNYLEALQAFREAGPMFDRAGAPIGLVIAALETGDVQREVGENPDAASAYRRANELFANVAIPVSDANRYLGLPPVESIGIWRMGDMEDPYDIDGFGQFEPVAGVPDEEALVAENLANFPNQNSPARALVADLEARLAEAMAFVNTLN